MVGSVAPSFFKSEVFKKHQSNPEVGKYSEDLRFMGEVLLDKMKYGVITNATYYYRKRTDKTSSQDGITTDINWYLITPKTALISLINYSKLYCNNVPKFIQFMVMYDLQWRLKRFGNTILSSSQIDEYQTIIVDILRLIDDDVITAVKNINSETKIYSLDLKHDFHEKTLSQEGKLLKYNDILISQSDTLGLRLYIDFIEIKDNILVIDTNYLGFATDVSIYAKLGDNIFRPESTRRKPNQKKMFINKVVDFPSRGFKFTIPYEQKNNSAIYFYANISNKPLRVIPKRFSGLSRLNMNSYTINNGFIIRKAKFFLTFKPYNIFRHIGYEVRYLLTLLVRYNLRKIPQPIKMKWLILNKGTNTNALRKGLYACLRIILIPFMSVRTIISSGPRKAFRQFLKPFLSQLLNNLKTVTTRLIYFITKPIYKRKNIWMFMDRSFDADDSAEILYEYVVKQNPNNITPIFTIKHDSPDYSRIGRIGTIVPFLSWRQKLLFLHTKKMISSHADDIMINPFRKKIEDYLDLFHFDYIFLQHGIIKDDISNWLNRYNKNIKLFVTSSKREYQSILDYDYFYDSSVVKLTGLPRYDKLNNNPENKIALAPTWRQYLASKASDADRHYSETFKETYYFRYYQAFLKHERLNRVLKANNLTMQFYIHPSFKAQYVDFTPGECVEVKKVPYDYKKVKSISKLMITDYSSVVFDFAYLRKPIIYTQFDEDFFWNGHISNKGYFDYRKDGFGPVMTDLESTIDKIIEYIERDFQLEDIYLHRIENYFNFNDKKNSERVYKEIIDQDRGL
jgi:CDP-glycerol glycerophosphotransferase (TagB/SpsB family)